MYEIPYKKCVFQKSFTSQAFLRHVHHPVDNHYLSSSLESSLLSPPKILRVNKKFSETFAHMPPSTTDPTVDCTTMTLYVKPCGVITQHTPPGVMNYDAQIAYITRDKMRNTHNTRNKYTSPRQLSSKVTAVVYTVVQLLINW